MKKISKISIILLCAILCTCSWLDNPTKSKIETYYFVVESEHSASEIIYQRPNDIQIQIETFVLVYPGHPWELEFTGSKGDSVTIGVTSIDELAIVRVGVCDKDKEILKNKIGIGSVILRTIL